MDFGRNHEFNFPHFLSNEAQPTMDALCTFCLSKHKHVCVCALCVIYENLFVAHFIFYPQPASALLHHSHKCGRVGTSSLSGA